MDIIKEYQKMSAEERINIMLRNYQNFSNMIQIEEAKIKHDIKSEKEYLRSQARGKLGVRVQVSGLSNPTYEEVETNIMIDESIESGTADSNLLKGIEDSSVYKERIHMLRIMRMDYILLETVVENMDREDSELIKLRLCEGLTVRQIAAEKSMGFEAVRARISRIRRQIREQIIDNIQKNCRGDKCYE